jgi:haloacid dehalogenase superfamily, subfamily IA, variant 3 with third motif having DD or ED/haloacid dehalogenase superfamily, subfamily IA, variant 1 with third motif having Dx(3-4)D or Dx(3-4)E
MESIAALFDLDGTLIDTEPQYTRFWVEQGIKYCQDPELGLRIKGSTLKQILEEYFTPELNIHQKIVADLNFYESQMDFSYISGTEDFLRDLKKHGVKTAIVTSSDLRKMNFVFQAHPEIKSYFDAIVLAEDYHKSKPDPDCFLTAAEKLDVKPSQCIVFEDSHFGLQAGNNAKMTVIGLSTSLPVAEVQSFSSLVIPDYSKIRFADLQELLHDCP